LPFEFELHLNCRYTDNGKNRRTYTTARSNCELRTNRVTVNGSFEPETLLVSVRALNQLTIASHAVPIVEDFLNAEEWLSRLSELSYQLIIPELS